MQREQRFLELSFGGFEHRLARRDHSVSNLLTVLLFGAGGYSAILRQCLIIIIMMKRYIYTQTQKLGNEDTELERGGFDASFGRIHGMESTACCPEPPTTIWTALNAAKSGNGDTDCIPAVNRESDYERTSSLRIL